VTHAPYKSFPGNHDSAPLLGRIHIDMKLENSSALGGLLESPAVFSPVNDCAVGHGDSGAPDWASAKNCAVANFNFNNQACGESGTGPALQQGVPGCLGQFWDEMPELRHRRERLAGSRPALPRSNNDRYVISACCRETKAPMLSDPVHAFPIQERIATRSLDEDFDYPALNRLASDLKQDRTRSKCSELLQPLEGCTRGLERWALNDDGRIFSH